MCVHSFIRLTDRLLIIIVFCIDLVDMIQQSPKKVLGPCSENGYEIINAEGFNITSSELQNNLANPYCIGFAVDTLSIDVTLAYFYNNSYSNFIGSLNITSGRITYTIGSGSVTFIQEETSGNQQLYQLCADESKQITLYNGCSVVHQRNVSNDFRVPGKISLQVLKDIKNPFKVSKVLLYIHIHACILSAYLLCIILPWCCRIVAVHSYNPIILYSNFFIGYPTLSRQRALFVYYGTHTQN